MFSSYLKIAIRNIRRNPVFSIINISGLAIGLMFSILIMLFVVDDLSFDKYHEYQDRIYRVSRVGKDKNGAKTWGYASCAPSFVPLLKNDFPEIESIARLFGTGGSTVSVDEKSFSEQRFYFAENEIFDIFTIPFVEGNSQSVLVHPNTVVLTESMQQKYFGSETAIGKSILLDGQYNLKVTGVIRDVPDNSHIHYDFLASYLTLKGLQGEGENDYFHGSRNFSDNVTLVYLKLIKSASVEEMSQKIPDFLNRHLGDWKDSEGKIIKPGEFSGLSLMKVTDIHLNGKLMGEVEPNSDIRYVRLFILLGIFILLIASINFINLSTARAMKRAKEIGIRKVTGAQKNALISQLLSESLFISLIATVIAILLVYLVTPVFNSFVGRNLHLNILLNPHYMLIIIAMFCLVGIIAGAYPAFYLASFRPSRILRGEITRGKKGVALRKALVILQFTISIALMICVSIIFRQLQFIQNAHLGFDRENIILVTLSQDIRTQYDEFKKELLKNPAVQSVTVTHRSPSGQLGDCPGYSIEVDGQRLNNPFQMPHNRVGFDFFKTYGIDIIAGRAFSEEYATDQTEAFLLNETAVKRFGWTDPAEAIDARIWGKGREGTVIGVMRDIHYESLHVPIKPMITYIVNWGRTMAIRINSENIPATIRGIEQTWRDFQFGNNFNYSFLDERLNNLYKNEQRMMQLFGYFSLLAMLIACLGLFGLALFTVENRTKEIGIRKTLGASVSGIIRLLSIDFIKWVLVANLIALPLVIFPMRNWLQNFAYRVNIRIMDFLVTGLIALLFALITVAYHSIRAAFLNPAKTLKYE